MIRFLVQRILRLLTGNFASVRELKVVILVLASVAVLWIGLSWRFYPKENGFSVMSSTISYLGSPDLERNPHGFLFFRIGLSLLGLLFFMLTMYRYRRMTRISRFGGHITSSFYLLGVICIFLIVYVPDSKNTLFGNLTSEEVHNRIVIVAFILFGLAIVCDGIVFAKDYFLWRSAGGRRHFNYLKIVPPFLIFLALALLAASFLLRWDIKCAHDSSLAHWPGNGLYSFPLWEWILSGYFVIFMCWIPLLLPFRLSRNPGDCKTSYHKGNSLNYTQVEKVDKNLTSSDRYWIWGPLLFTSVLIHLIYFTKSNQLIFLELNRLSQYTGDSLWAYLTICGDGLVGIVLLLPWIRWRSDVVWTTFLAIIFATLTVQGLKLVFGVPRPPMVLEPGAFHIIGKKYMWGSFPSGHTATIFTIVGVWVFAISRTWLRSVLLGFAMLVGISRVIVGAHWPLDILGGTLVGWVAAQVGYTLVKNWTWGIRPSGQCLLGMFLLFAGIGLLFLHNTGYPQSLLLQRSIALICLAWGGFEFIYLLQKAFYIKLL